MAYTDGTLVGETHHLLRQTLDGYNHIYGFGSMKGAIYDTAWVSMVTKVTTEGRQWLFPECFHQLLKTQEDGGGWDSGAPSQVDKILNTAASLLSLIRHSKDPLNIQNLSQEDLVKRIASAESSLQCHLNTWNPALTTHVAFEIIVPSLLALLSQEGIVMSFTEKDNLMRLNSAQLSSFKPEYLHGKVRLTALHSLEAFVGVIDFVKVIHHKIKGAMMASPSSTAAYLMYASKWDAEAEAYLRHVVKTASIQDNSIPSAYPSTYFEITWILSTLLRAGFAADDLKCVELDKITKVLIQDFYEGNGTIGFAPSLNPDMDDTAKGLLSLSLLGTLNGISAEGMVKAFEAENHFRTYARETNPSFSANCNALLAFLRQPDLTSYEAPIKKVVKILCDSWWDSDGAIKDKWNICSLYSTMLLVEALSDLQACIGRGGLRNTFTAADDLMARLAITLCQACLRPMLQQKDDGSWGHSVEQTSYGILISAEARRLAVFEPIKLHIDAAIKSAAQFILTPQSITGSPERL